MILHPRTPARTPSTACAGGGRLAQTPGTHAATPDAHHAAHPAGTGRHPLRRLFAHPDFVRLWAVGALANAMRWVEILVAAVFTFEVTGSALAVSLVAVLRALPMLLPAPPRAPSRRCWTAGGC